MSRNGASIAPFGRAICSGCYEVSDACFGVSKDRGMSFICKDCLFLLDEFIAAMPCALVWAYYDHPLKALNRTPQGEPVEQIVTRLVNAGSKRLGFEKWACEKCDLVFTSRDAKMRHIDEKHRI